MLFVSIPLSTKSILRLCLVRFHENDLALKLPSEMEVAPGPILLVHCLHCLQRSYCLHCFYCSNFLHYLNSSMYAYILLRKVERYWNGLVAFGVGDGWVTGYQGHTCKKRVMLRSRLFWPKKICGKSA